MTIKLNMRGNHSLPKWGPRRYKKHNIFYVLDCLLLIHDRGKTTHDIHARARFYEWKFSPNFHRPFCEWKTTGKSSRKLSWGLKLWLVCYFEAPPMVARLYGVLWFDWLKDGAEDSFISQVIHLDKKKRNLKPWKRKSTNHQSPWPNELSTARKASLTKINTHGFKEGSQPLKHSCLQWKYCVENK